MNVFLKSFLLVLLGLACAIADAAPATGVSVVESFELSNGGFTTTSVDSWKWGPPTSPHSPGAAHSGSQVWGTNLIGSYPANLDATVVSPAYDLSAGAGQHIILHWWQHLITEEGFDYAEVQVSKDNGGTWTTVFGPGHGAVNPEWTQHTVLLDPSFATDGFRVRFRLVSDNSTSVGGFFIDDLRISSASFTEAAAVQDFEADDGGYTETGANSSWEYGTPVSAPGAAFSGNSVWATNLTGFYNANEDSTLTSPVHDLSAAAGKLLAVTWMQHFDTEEGYDFLSFEVSADGGGTWTPLSIRSGPLSTDGWMSQQAFVPSAFATSTFRLRFRLTSDEAYQYDGVAIDDISILATHDLFPTAGSFAKAAPENYPIAFAADDFSALFVDPDGGVLTGIVIDQLPAVGTLKLDGAAVALNDTIPTADLGTLTFEPPAGTTGSWSFVYHASNHFGPSAPATVALNIVGPTPQVMIAENPKPVTVNPNSPATFEVVAVSSLPLEYQWRKDGVNIPGANSATYTIESAVEADEDDYDVVVSNSGDSATSNQAALSVNDPVVILTEPGPQSINEGGDISFGVTAAGTGRLDYQWYRDEELLVGETFAQLSIEDAEEADAGVYQCVVTNIVGPTPSAPFTLTVNLGPRIIAQPLSIGVARTRTATFNVKVEGAGPFTYQWFKDDFEIPAATGASLVIKDVREVNIGTYTVRVDNGWASTMSQPAQLQVVNWVDMRGIFQDVLERDAAPEGETAFPGRITVTSNGNGSASVLVTYDGTTHRFAAAFDPQLVIQRAIARGKRSPLNVRLQLDTLEKTIAVTVSHQETSGLVTSTALLPKHAYVVRVNPAPQIGRYTALLTPEAGVPGVPKSRAFVTGTVSAAGLATWTGRLPNGLVLTSSGYIHTTGRVPLHMILAGAGGEVCGRFTYDLTGEIPLVNGTLAWRHLPKVRATFMTAPFVSVLTVQGSLYRAPTGVLPVLELPQGSEMFALLIEGPITDGTLERWVRLAPRNAFLIDPATTANITIRVSPTVGTLTGTFIDAATKQRHTMQGVVVQGHQLMGGFFRSVGEPGEFLITPRLQ